MTLRDDYRAALETGDVDTCVAIMRQVNPGHPVPASREEAEVTMHLARTTTKTIPLKARAYSHRWLTERGLPSRLPDELRAKAERMYPRVVEGVFASSVTTNSLLRPVSKQIEKAMADAVAEVYADTKPGISPDPVVVRRQMLDARERKRRFFRDLLMSGVSNGSNR